MKKLLILLSLISSEAWASVNYCVANEGYRRRCTINAPLLGRTRYMKDCCNHKETYDEFVKTKSK